jgi:uncharacterized protein YccT (UPF0319 family)
MYATIDNTEPRVRRLILASSEPVLDGEGNEVKHRQVVTHKPVTFKPGLNYLEEIEALELESELAACSELRKVDPEDLNEKEAIALAGRTGSLEALDMWSKTEDRSPVLAAIKAQVEKIAPKVG